MSVALHASRPMTTASRRTVLRALAASAAVPALGGCAGLSLSGPAFEAAEISAHPTLLVATTRKPADVRPTSRGSAPNAPRSASPSRAVARRRDGSRWPRSGSTNGGSTRSTGAGAERTVANAVPARRSDLRARFQPDVRDRGPRRRAACDGVAFRGDAVVFSWPSKAKLLDYVNDRDSAMWSRDSLEQVLAGFIARAARGRVHVVAHSVGTTLTMEALRQIYKRRCGSRPKDRRRGVRLARPRHGRVLLLVERLGPLARSIIFITATNDRALALSACIAGGIRGSAPPKRPAQDVWSARHRCLAAGLGYCESRPVPVEVQIRQVIRDAMDGRPAERA